MKLYLIAASLFVVAFVALVVVAMSVSQNLQPPRKPAAAIGSNPAGIAGTSTVTVVKPPQAQAPKQTQSPMTSPMTTTPPPLPSPAHPPLLPPASLSPLAVPPLPPPPTTSPTAAPTASPATPR